MVQLHQQHAVSWGCAGAERKHAEATPAAAAYTDAWGAASDAGTDTTANTECMSSTVCTVAAGGRSSVGSSDDDSHSPCPSAAVVAAAAAVLEPPVKELPRGLRRLSHCTSSVSASPEQRRLRAQTLGSVAPPSPTASHGASSTTSLCEYLRIECEVAAAAAAAAAASAGAAGSAPCTPRDQIQGGAAASSGLTPLLREGFFSDEVELKTVRKRGRSVADGGDCDEGATHTDEECSPPCAKRRHNSLSHSPAPPSSVGSAHLNIFGELRAASARAAASLSPAPAALASTCAVPSLRPLFGDVVAAARHAAAEAAAAEAAAEDEDGSDWTGRSSSSAGGVSEAETEAGMMSEGGGVPAEVCERLDAAFSELLFLAKGGECEAAVDSAKRAVVQAVFDTLDAYPGVDLSSWMRLTSMVYQRCITEELQRRAAGIRAASVAPASPSPSHPTSVAEAGAAATVPVQRLNHRRSFYLAVVDTDDAESEEAECSASPAETAAAATSRAAAATGGDDGSKVLRQRGDWLEVACEQGVYYFNEETEESKWDAEGTGFDAASVNSAGEPAGDDDSPYRRRRTLLQMAQLLEDADAEDAATEAGTAEGDEEEVLRRIGDWLEVRCDQGLYYFNEETEESTWTKEGTAFEGEAEEEEEAAEDDDEGWSPDTHSPEGRAVKRMRSASPVRSDGCCDSDDEDEDDAWRHSPVKTPAKRARMADAPSATSVLAAAAAFEQAAAGSAAPAVERRAGAVASDLAMLQGLQRVSGEAAVWEAAEAAAAASASAQNEVPPAIADAICGVMFRERVAAAVADTDATSTEASPAEVSALGRAAFGLGPCTVPLLPAVDDDAAAATATDSGELTRRRRKKKRDAEKERLRKKEQKRRRRAAAATVALTPEPAAAAEAAAEAAVDATTSAATAPPALPSFLAVPPPCYGGRVATMSTSSTSTTTTTSSCSDYGDDTDLNATATSLVCDADADGADTHRRRRARRKDPAKERLRKKAQKKDKKKRRASAGEDEVEEGVAAGHGATEAAGITLELAGRLG